MLYYPKFCGHVFASNVREAVYSKTIEGKKQNVGPDSSLIQSYLALATHPVVFHLNFVEEIVLFD